MHEERRPRRVRRTISPERRGIYYLGMALGGIGMVLFLSVFVTGIARFGDFTDFTERARNEGMRALVGFALIAFGGMLMKIGSRGLAGSGVVLDPDKAREDLEPWSRMAGGMADDALSEVDAVQRLGEKLGPREVVKVRCRTCKALNDETDRFCGQCGAQLA
jgi:hypothetical protein